MYQIKLTKKAKKELKAIKEIHQTAINTALEELKEYPFIGKPLTKELTERFSYRIGVYKIIYKVNKHDGIITIIPAGHRGTIYT